jgi:hypothetical protein
VLTARYGLSLYEVSNRLFSYLKINFSVLFSPVVWQMPGFNKQRRSTARTLPRHGDFTRVTEFHSES